MTFDRHYSEAVTSLTARAKQPIDDAEHFAHDFTRDLIAHGWRHAYDIAPALAERRGHASENVREQALAEIKHALANREHHEETQ